MVSNPSSCSVVFAALMPHAPILIPSVAGERVARIQATVAAMREAARRAVATGADAVVIVSPHAPREPEAFGIWTSERLRGRLRAFGAPEEGVDFQNDAAVRLGRRVAFIASGDMSHRLTLGAPYGFDARGAEFDQWLIGTLRRGGCRELLDSSADLGKVAEEDALDSVLVALGATGFNANGTEVLSYEGPFGVSYGVAILYS
jgi:aromatic ring-opening dioxygenase LigB subunit